MDSERLAGGSGGPPEDLLADGGGEGVQRTDAEDARGVSYHRSRPTMRHETGPRSATSRPRLGVGEPFPTQASREFPSSAGEVSAQLVEFEELVDSQLGRALRRFGRRGRQEAEDLAQSVIVAILFAALEGKVPSDPRRRKRWIRGLVSNEIRSWLRAENRNHPRPHGGGGTATVDPPDQHPGPDGECEEAETSQAMEVELATLPETERQALVAYREGQSMEEIARLTVRSVKAARSFVKRVVARLRKRHRGR